MKTRFVILFAACIGLLFFAGCSKVKNTTSNNFTTADPNAKQHNQDVSETKSESDNVNTDVNTALSNVSGFGKNSATESFSVCGASIDSSLRSAPIKTLVINFDSTTICPGPNRIRSGSIKIELVAGTYWSDAGAQLRITYINYKVIFTDHNNHYLVFNGVKYLTDVTGIDWVTYYFSGGNVSATLKERSNNIQVTFDNGSTESWSSARLSTWSITGYTNITATVNGDTTINGQPNIDSWGTTRFNTPFTTVMVQPWKSGTTCGWWKPTQGKYTSTTTNFSVTATFGVDGNGNPVSSGCAYGLTLAWTVTASNTSGVALIQYW